MLLALTECLLVNRRMILVTASNSLLLDFVKSHFVRHAAVNIQITVMKGSTQNVEWDCAVEAGYGWMILGPVARFVTDLFRPALPPCVLFQRKANTNGNQLQGRGYR